MTQPEHGTKTDAFGCLEAEVLQESQRAFSMTCGCIVVTEVTGRGNLVNGGTINSGIYGMRGQANFTNRPGGRRGAALLGSEGQLNLYGGYGRASDFDDGVLDDFWHWDGKRWTWIGGSNRANQPPSDTPPARVLLLIGQDQMVRSGCLGGLTQRGPG